MPRPTENPDFATDANFVAGVGVPVDIVGLSTKLEPPAPNRAQGFVPGLGFVGEYANWMLNALGKHASWLREIIDVGGDLNYETPKTRSTIFSASPVNGYLRPGSPVSDWARVNGFYDETQVDGAGMVYEIAGLPPGCRIDAVKIPCRTNNAPGRPAQIRARILRARASVLVTPAPLDYLTPPNNIWEVFDNGLPPSLFDVDLPGSFIAGVGVIAQPFFVVDGYRYAVEIRGATDNPAAHQSDRVYGVVVEWTDFGPRSGG